MINIVQCDQCSGRKVHLSERFAFAALVCAYWVHCLTPNQVTNSFKASREACGWDPAYFGVTVEKCVVEDTAH